MSLANYLSGNVYENWLCPISTRDQNLDLQLDALRKAGCENL